MVRARLTLLCLVGCAGSTAPTRPTSVAQPVPAAPAPTPRPKPKPPAVVVVSIDGLCRDYLDDTTHKIPNLRRLIEEGTSARAVRSVWPSLTYPAHTTLVTGTVPARHGILHNAPFDPYDKNDGAWNWYARDIRVPTLWDAARDAGIDVVNVTWPVTVGANIRYNLPQIWQKKTDDDEALFCQHATAGLCAELKAKGVSAPLDHRPDAFRARAATTLIRAKHPRLAFVYLTDLDNAEHDAGPFSQTAFEALERSDALLGEIVAAARVSAPRVAVVLVSDHGFAPVTRETRPNLALRRAGLVTATRTGKVTAYEAFAWAAGGSAAVYLRTPTDAAVAARVRAAMDELVRDPASGVARVREGSDVEREGGFPGALLVLDAADGYFFTGRVEEPLTASTRYRGHHGHAPSRPEMLTSVVFWGDGVRRGGRLEEVRLVDVAPTIAKLAAIPFGAVEGEAIAAALE